MDSAARTVAARGAGTIRSLQEHGPAREEIDALGRRLAERDGHGGGDAE